MASLAQLLYHLADQSAGFRLVLQGNRVLQVQDQRVRPILGALRIQSSLFPGTKSSERIGLALAMT